jgi:hypothetical protein
MYCIRLNNNLTMAQHVLHNNNNLTMAQHALLCNATVPEMLNSVRESLYNTYESLSNAREDYDHPRHFKSPFLHWNSVCVVLIYGACTVVVHRLYMTAAIKASAAKRASALDNRSFWVCFMLVVLRVLWKRVSRVFPVQPVPVANKTNECSSILCHNAIHQLHELSQGWGLWVLHTVCGGLASLLFCNQLEIVVKQRMFNWQTEKSLFTYTNTQVQVAFSVVRMSVTAVLFTHYGWIAHNSVGWVNQGKAAEFAQFFVVWICGSLSSACIVEYMTILNPLNALCAILFSKSNTQQTLTGLLASYALVVNFFDRLW